MMASLGFGYITGSSHFEPSVASEDAIEKSKQVGALCHAAATGDVTKVKILLAKGVPIEGDRVHRPPLLCAAFAKQYFTVRLLLDSGANPDAREHGRSYTVLHQISDPDIATMLLKFGASVKVRNPWNRYTPLHYASCYHSSQKIQLLLKYHSDINAVDKDGQTPLFLALKKGRYLIALQLLQAGANSNIPNFKGESPLQLVQKNGKLCDRVMREELLEKLNGQAGFFSDICRVS